MNKTVYLSFLWMLLLMGRGNAQDIQFSQYYNSPLYLNPGFTGITPHQRLVANHRMQWPNLTQPFSSFAFSYDMFSNELRSGFGIIATTDKMGVANWTTTTVSLLYSYKIRLSKKWVFSPGLQFGYGTNGIDRSKLRLGDGLELEFDQGGSYQTFDPLIYNLERSSYFDFSSGGLVHNRSFWFGAAFHHMNQPNVSLTGDINRLPMKGTLHTGFRFNLSDPKSNTRPARISYLTPSLMYRWQGNTFSQFDIGVNYHIDPISVGFWYRGKLWEKNINNSLAQDALVFYVGFYAKSMTIGYSYDFTISELGTSSGGAHEISIMYQFTTRQQYKSKYRLIPCPTFNNKDEFWK